ncbi:spore coat protein [Paenibacillus solisilvae]|uniref:Spore coat protein n=1 Tax=Paenibacillus solisilvae TaxID=2486751 RepID=A0ABW0VRD1_9BACL
MYQQQGQAQHHQSLLPDEDLAYTVLSDLKRVVREYATAATESSCPQIRQLFTNLLNSTLQLQGQLFKAMESQNMYSTASPALRQEVDKQIKQNQQMEQKTAQLLQQIGAGQQQFQPFMQNQQHQQMAGQQQNQNQFYS